MAINVREFQCSPDDVFRVLADGWLFPVWVVGASRMRAVDRTWPAVRAHIYHSVGAWPVLLDDVSTVEVWDPPVRCRLTAKVRPFGEFFVELEVRTHGSGCMVRIREDAISGAVRMVPGPLRRAAMNVRNEETLRRLAFLSEGQAG